MPTISEKIAAVRAWFEMYCPNSWESEVLAQHYDDARIEAEVKDEPTIGAAISKIVWCIAELHTQPKGR